MEHAKPITGLKYGGGTSAVQREVVPRVRQSALINAVRIMIPEAGRVPTEIFMGWKDWASKWRGDGKAGDDYFWAIVDNSVLTKYS